MNKYWFKPKCFGWGFCPTSWEGWVTTLVLLGVLLLSAYVNGFSNSEINSKEGLNFLFDLFIIIGVFTALFRDKVEGGLRWNWGCKC